jgi:hypothetical protein
LDKRRSEAAEQFREVVAQILAGGVPLPLILKRGLDACILANWPEYQQWFTGELNGFYGDQDQLP